MIKPQDNEGKPILHLTDAAVEKVKYMMGKENKQGYGLRVDVITGGCAGLSYDMRLQKDPYSNDITIKQGDLQILINPESIKYLNGSEIDYIDTLKESGFQYRNPNAKKSCSCGISFS